MATFAPVVSNFGEASFLGLLPGEFQKIRSESFLQELYGQSLALATFLQQETSSAPSKRHSKLEVMLHKLHYPFGKKPVVGLLLAFNTTRGYEIFDEHHFFSAVTHLLPEAKKIDQSHQVFHLSQAGFHLHYLEITAPKNEEMARDWQGQLGKLLPTILERFIQPLAPATFARPNQEELFHKLSLLGAELTDSADLPQVVISYEEHDHQDLQFVVVLARCISSESARLEEQLRAQSGFLYLPHQKGIIGKLDEITFKEAHIFSCRFGAKEFFRPDLSIDLYQARAYVANLLESLIGPFRDFNGGLLQKQFEALARLKASLSYMGTSKAFLLENFFFSFSPIASQSTLPTPPIKRLFEILLELEEASPEPASPHFQERKEEGDFHYLHMIRIQSGHLQEVAERALSEIVHEGGGYGITKLRLEGDLYIGWLSLSSDPLQKGEFQKRVISAIEKAVFELERNQHLRLAITCSDPCLDPRITRCDESSAVVKLLFEGLTRMGEGGRQELAIANGIDVTTDGLVYTFTLREACWSNGKQVTAYDFECSWKKALDRSVDSVHHYLFYCIKNARKVYQQELPPDALGVKSLSNSMLRVTLEHPMPTFIEFTTHWSYLPAYHGLDENDPAWAYHSDGQLICNGPYAVFFWSHRRELILRKNPTYWDTNAITTKEVHFTFVSSLEEEVSLFRKGLVDIAGSLSALIPPPRVSLQKGQEQIHYDASGVYCLFFNTKRAPFNHLKMRRALEAAIDRKEVLADLSWEEGEPTYSFLPPSLSQVSPLPSRRDEAPQLLEEACKELGLSFASLPPIEISYAKASGRKAIASSLKRQWEEVLGLKVTLKEDLWEPFFRKVQEGDFAVANMIWTPWFSDSFMVLQGLTNQPATSNPCHWQSERFLQVMNLASYELCLERRNELLKQAEEILIEEVPLISLFGVNGTYLKNSALKGVHVGNLYEINVRDCFFHPRKE